MKILIITFTGGVNPGTFMQALGVKVGFQTIFPDATIDYLQFPDFKRNLGVHSRDYWSWNVIKRKSYAAYRLLKYNRLRKESFHYTKRIDLFDYDKKTIRDILSQYDLVSIGSDTILEKAQNDLNERIGINWLSSDLYKGKYIFFSASASPANFELTEPLRKKLLESAMGASYIGLRDHLTYNLFKNIGISEKRLSLQPDPTFLLDASKFHLGNYYEKKLKGKQICLYNFAADCPFRKKLSDELRCLGYIIATTAYNPDADISIDTIDPLQWAGVFRHCSLVITERFHDTVFSLRNAVPVIAVDWDKSRFAVNGDSKTLRILEDYDLTDYHFNITKMPELDELLMRVPKLISSWDREQVQKHSAEICNEAEKQLHQIVKLLMQ